MRLMVFFFSSRRRHTRYIGDWSSDVCSSDLNGQIEVFQCDLLRTGIPERDVVKTDAFARTDRRNHRFFGRDHQRLQLEKLEEISKEQRILIKLPDVFQKRASQIQPLLKGLVEECQVAQGYESTKGSRHHPDQPCTGYGPRGNTRH